MDVATFNDYLIATKGLRAQQSLEFSKVVSFPHMKSSPQRRAIQSWRREIGRHVEGTSPGVITQQQLLAAMAESE